MFVLLIQNKVGHKLNILFIVCLIAVKKVSVTYFWVIFFSKLSKIDRQGIYSIVCLVSKYKMILTGKFEPYCPLIQV